MTILYLGAETFSPPEQEPAAGTLLRFDLRDEEDTGKTVSNLSMPFMDAGRNVLLGREETWWLEDDSKTGVFVHQPERDTWALDSDAPHFSMQDPFYCGTFTDGESSEPYQVFGGVRLGRDAADRPIGRDTAFFRYKGSLNNLAGPTEPEPFAAGPYKMKDIRLIQLPNGRIGVFTRPQQNERTGFGGLGSIGYMEIDSLDELESSLHSYSEAEDSSTLIVGLFEDGEWGGANQLELLPDGRIGILAHRARFYPDEDGQRFKEYEAVYFTFDPDTRTATPMRTIATQKDFPLPIAPAQIAADSISSVADPGYVPPKFADHGDIVFPAGLVDNGDKTSTLYAGIGDLAAGKLTIPTPES